MDPLYLFRAAAALVIFAICWQGVFATFPYGFGPWFVGRYIFWLDRDGLQWRRGR